MEPICAREIATDQMMHNFRLCGTHMKPETNGVFFEEGRTPDPSEGLPNPAPYKLWVGDLWKCPRCGSQVIVGVPPQPLAEHYMPNYAEMAATFPPLLRTRDR